MNTGMFAYWLMEFFTARNLLFWPLFLVSVLVITICADLFRRISREKKDSTQFLDEFQSGFSEQDREKLVRTCQDHPGILAESALILVQNATMGPLLVKKSVNHKKLEFFRNLKRRLPQLETLSSIGPVFGFLGTVFSTVQIYLNFSGLTSPQVNSLMGTAFLTTVFGLLLSLFGILALNYFSEEISEEEEHFETQYQELESLVFIMGAQSNGQIEKKAA